MRDVALHCEIPGTWADTRNESSINGEYPDVSRRACPNYFYRRTRKAVLLHNAPGTACCVLFHQVRIWLQPDVRHLKAVRCLRAIIPPDWIVFGSRSGHWLAASQRPPLLFRI